MRQVQVDKSNYIFSKYVTKQRLSSIWHQMDEVLATGSSKVLEIGPGTGIFKALASALGVKVETLDLDSELKPDYVSSVESLPFEDSTYDTVCAFQVLEHLPYDAALTAFKEMVRVSRGYLIISLPDSRVLWRYSLHIPKLGSVDFLIPKPQIGVREHVFDGQHYWEINKKGYPLKKVMGDFSCECKLIKTYRVKENPYHRFFIYAKLDILNK
jgi:predicted SAM-dependent methyltransferase